MEFDMMVDGNPGALPHWLVNGKCPLGTAAWTEEKTEKTSSTSDSAYETHPLSPPRNSLQFAKDLRFKYSYIRCQSDAIEKWREFISRFIMYSLENDDDNSVISWYDTIERRIL